MIGGIASGMRPMGSGRLQFLRQLALVPFPFQCLRRDRYQMPLLRLYGRMPEKGRASMRVSLPRPDDYLHFASRGFFAYDWRDVHRSLRFSYRYELQSRPNAPTHVSELPEEFQSLLRSTAFADLSFADSPKIDVIRYFECESAAREEKPSFLKRLFGS